MIIKNARLFDMLPREILFRSLKTHAPLESLPLPKIHQVFHILLGRQSSSYQPIKRDILLERDPDLDLHIIIRLLDLNVIKWIP